MRADTFADLFDLARLSRSRLDHAIRTAAPRAAQVACGGASSRTTPLVALRNDVIDALPDALNVGLRECIVRCWPPRDAAALDTTWPARFVLQTRATLDSMHDGAAAFSLRLTARATLSQPDGRLRVDASATELVLTPRAWLAELTLSVADDVAAAASTSFHEQTSEVFLAAGPWPLR